MPKKSILHIRLKTSLKQQIEKRVEEQEMTITEYITDLVQRDIRESKYESDR